MMEAGRIHIVRRLLLLELLALSGMFLIAGLTEEPALRRAGAIGLAIVSAGVLAGIASQGWHGRSSVEQASRE